MLVVIFNQMSDIADAVLPAPVSQLKRKVFSTILVTKSIYVCLTSEIVQTALNLYIIIKVEGKHSCRSPYV